VELSHEHDEYKWLEIENLDGFDTRDDLKPLSKLGLIE
jgi:hypothetical protein